MPYLVGIAVALAVGVMGTLLRLDRDRAYYATILMVVAHYYVLFTVVSGSNDALLAEGIAMAGFLVVAAVGFRKSMWLVAAGLTAHGIFDVFHGRLIDNPGIPSFWGPFCIGFDVAAGAYLFILLLRETRKFDPA